MDVVQLFVKSPNHSVKDFQVECQLKWTVGQLKEFLSTVYPGRPSPSNQRLVYAGKMLQNSAVVREALDRPVGGAVVMVHLVCATPTTESPTVSATKVTATVDSTDRHDHPPTPVTEPVVQTPTHDSSTSVRSPDANRYQRSASVDAAASPYATPHHHFWRQHSLAMPPGYEQPHVPPLSPQLVHPMYAAYIQYYQQQQQLRHRNQTPVASQTPHAADVVNHNGAPPPPAVAGGNGDRPQAPVAMGEEDRREAERFQNVAMNAGPGMADVGQNNARRDWVDTFYKLFTFLLLMSLVYFSASMSKFLTFSVIILFLIVYQAGWFNLRRQRQGRPPDVRGQQEVRPGNDHQQNNNADEVADDGGLADRPSILGTVLMFLMSFFASLIPQRQQEIAGN